MHCNLTLNCMGFSRRTVLFLSVSLIAGNVLAQDPPSEAKPDSMLSYDLAEIVINDGTIFEAEAYTVQKVALADIVRENAISVSDIARLIPAAHIQTNSRGESLIYLRNAGERQVALFFNGALLNVPWDNRMNLDLIPASVIGGMTVAKGVPSTLYGTNVLGGAVNITTRSLDSDESVTEIGGHGGAHGTSNVMLTHLLSHKGFKFTGSAGYSTRNGMPLSDGAGLPFNQSDRDLRTNTDREMINMFAQASYRFAGGAEVGLSYLLVNGDFGIAPESHLDPADTTVQVRYWRYPKWENNTLVINSSIPVGSKAIFRGAAWGSWFGQHIDAYGTSLYNIREEQQRDEDATLGTRLTWIQEVGVGQLSVAANLLTSDHEEVTVEANERGQINLATANAPTLYRQTVYSFGAEYTVPFTQTVKFNLGGSYDGITTPETGGIPSGGPVSDFGLSSGLQLRLSDTRLLRVSAGRKVRFPTMRELFGVALDRFLLNPDLRPETSFVSELALITNGDRISGEVIGFYQRTFDTIDQQRVEVGGRQLRQRINLEGSRVYGVELVGKAKPHPSWDVDGHLTGMRVRGIEEGETTFLTEKPAFLGSLSVQHRHASGFALLGQMVYTGKAYGRAESNDLVSLSTSIVLDAKLSYRFVLGSRPVFGVVFIRADNVLDAVVYPQLGLPGAGRFISIGADFSF